MGAATAIAVKGLDGSHSCFSGTAWSCWVLNGVSEAARQASDLRFRAETGLRLRTGDAYSRLHEMGSATLS
jgi:hypothetical protein